MGKAAAAILLLVLIFTGVVLAQELPPSFTGQKTWRHRLASVTFDVVAFDESRHNLSYSDRVLIKIDKLDYSGSDGSVPRTEFHRITARFGDKSFAIPRSVYQDLFNPDIEDGVGIRRPARGVMAFEFGGGDGAGSYRAKFIVDVRKGRVKRLLYEFPEPERAKVKLARLW